MFSSAVESGCRSIKTELAISSGLRPLLAGPGYMVEEQSLDRLHCTIPIDLKRAGGHGLNLALAGLICPVFGLPLGLDTGDPGVNATGVFLIAHGLVEQLPKSDQFRPFHLDLVFEGLVHEVDR